MVEEKTVSWTVTQIRGNKVSRTEDLVAHEEPLEMQVNDAPWMVVMRTPGDEIAHTAGLLLSEGLIRSGKDLRTITFCESGNQNRVRAYLAPEAPGSRPGGAPKAAFLSKSSCGLCGKEMLEDIAQGIRVCRDGVQVTREALFQLLEQTIRSQDLFASTGGAHAVGLYSLTMQRLGFAEDVGRHNAMDKAIGQALLDRKLEGVALGIASSRASFEMVQKAAAAAVPILATVSAPTDLALAVALRAKMTLVGFLRGDRMNIYTHPERIVLS